MHEVCDLAHKECVPCKGGVPPLKGEALKKLHQELGNHWQVVRDHHLQKPYTFNRYMAGVAFANKVAQLAEEQGHHPDMLITYDTVTVTIWTHKIDGLTESDFIFAAKTDTLL